MDCSGAAPGFECCEIPVPNLEWLFLLLPADNLPSIDPGLSPRVRGRSKDVSVARLYLSGITSVLASEQLGYPAGCAFLPESEPRLISAKLFKWQQHCSTSQPEMADLKQSPLHTECTDQEYKYC